MGDRTAFFYGTLMAPPVLHRVIYGTTTPEPWQKALTKTHPALLQGYTRHKAKDLDYPGILPAPQPPSHSSSTTTPTPQSQSQSPTPPSVRGTLVTGLTSGDIWRLDIFEGDQYTRRPVTVKLLRDDIGLTSPVDETRLHVYVVGECQAETYVWVADPSELEGEEWDFEEFRREKMWAWVGEGRGGGDGDGLVEQDEGFKDVDRAVREEGNGQKVDGTGGRGIGGGITRELERVGV